MIELKLQLAEKGRRWNQVVRRMGRRKQRGGEVEKNHGPNLDET